MSRLLEVRGLHAAYGPTRVLHGIDLDVEAGRVVALRFLSARAERGRAPEKRRVTLRFRAVVDED